MNLFYRLMAMPATTDAAAAEGAAPLGGGIIDMLIPFALIIGVFYFLIIRPQNRRQKETQKMLNAIKKGDKIVTIGGIYGVISKVKEQSVVVKVDDGTEIEFSRSAVSSVVNQTKADEGAKTDEKTAASEKKSGSGLGGIFGLKKKNDAVDAPATAVPEQTEEKEAEEAE
jgi:preprotein translocase subunit YajC